jgi:3-oxoadipate enol-lactonase
MLNRIDVGGAELEIAIGGSGEASAPVVCAAHPAEAFGDGTVALLSEVSCARVVCVNLRGLGGSSPLPPDAPYPLETMVDDLEAVRARLGLPPWVFWGMSGGGWLGQLYAHRHPHALAGLILESTCACFRARLDDPACVLSPRHAAWSAKLSAAGLLARAAATTTAPIDPAAVAGEWIEVAQVGSVFTQDGHAVLVSPGPLSAQMRRAMPELVRFDARAWLSSLRLPTLVLCGSADPIVPVAHARALHEAIADSSFLELSGAGHVPVTEKRVELVQAARRFLAERVGGAA